jgi:hypothetical protein
MIAGGALHGENMNYKIGYMVQIDCMSGLGTGGPEKITNIKTKYNEYTGKPYKVICFGDHEFDAVSGIALTPPYSYYIEPERN